ncbi:uncharacterized protein IL334_001492 [Kwoniella shivajii]|uniref:Uncharacterized protein n=1 Tax=Kwoniella shivajii TaxID=564305 RepID=A0ABZ1CSF3_9TREE|nr:hypothetical protein IL334_001492 [Kwoniella shivajii]
MGGNAFGTVARRLSQAEYEALKNHVHTALKLHFQDVKTPRSLLSKVDHGDLDVLVGYEGFLPGGDEEWTPNNPDTKNEDELPTAESLPAPDPLLEEVIKKLDIKPAEVSDTLKDLSGPNNGGEIKVIGTGKMVLGKEVDELRDFCGKMRASIGATAWRRRGGEVSFKVSPVVVNPDLDVRDDEFYQVDVLFTPSENLAFYHLMASYSSTGLLLGRFVRLLSHSFTLHLTHLIVRHGPFFGLPSIDVTLTTSPTDFCKWLGLDYDVWKTQGDAWNEEKDLWIWLTNVEEDSLAGQAISRIVAKKRSSSNDPKEGKRKKRADFADRFYEWLRNESKLVSSPEEEFVLPDISVSPTPTPTPTPIPILPSEQIASPIIADSKSLFIESSSSAANAIKIEEQIIVNPSLLNPNHPKSLDARVDTALEYWNKRELYDTILQERKLLAVVLADRQKETVENREKAAINQAEYELEVKDW